MAVITCGETHPDINGCTARVETYTGAVIATYEENGYDDSDWVAVVWDAAAGDVRTVCYASTRSWTYHNSAAVDATPAARAAAIAAGAQRLAAKRQVEITDGTVVTSLTTRGRNVGVTGTVRWSGQDRYRNHQVGVAVPGETKLRFLNRDRVTAVTPDAESADAAVAAAARDLAAGYWSQLFRR